MKSILVLDNFDSFTFNLVQILREHGGCKVEVHRNNAIELSEIARFDGILLSPGPGIPSEAGVMLDMIRSYCQSKPILGVCLGHQAIGEVFGATLHNLALPFHGRSEIIRITVPEEPLFDAVPKTFKAGRYHSWVVANDNFPPELEVTATDESGSIMALRHRVFDVRGVQFHPESVLTENGTKLIANWLARV